MTKDKIFLLGEGAFILGVFLFPYVHIGLWMLYIAAALLSSVFLCSEGKIRTVLLIGFFLIAGLWRFAVLERSAPSDAELAALTDKEMRLECRVAAVPEVKKGKQQIVLEIEGKRPFAGKILAYESAFEGYAYGDKVVMKGALNVAKNFDDFDYRRYLRGKGIYMVSYYPELRRTGNPGGLRDLLYSFRKRSDRNIRQILPAPAGNIVSAMTLGTDSEEIEEVMEDFNQTGTSHVIAVSGYHMVVVAAILTYLLRGLGVGRIRRFYLIIGGIFCFAILSGSEASAVRSAIMAAVFLFASQIGRGGDALRILIFSAAVMIFANPRILAADVGFQLSFLATLGLVVILPRLTEKARSLPKLGGLKDMLLTTLAAQIAVFPILILNFGQFSFLSFIANILILPTVPLIMIGGFFLIAASFLSMPLAEIIALPIYVLTAYEIEVVDILSRTGWGIINI